ncbi:hypothetical protein B0H13DRAFT_1627029 [Mycena leptocephala]|nr:hypothetical protein B0H13DRAFT_1627029 [Mycena leptocephala]
MAYNYNNNPNNERYANARYLLGMGPMPPPTSRELAVAHMQHTLNHGIFNGQDGDTNPALPHGKLEVHVPAPAEPESATTQATIAPPIRLGFSINDILPGDFLSRICANMDLTPANAQLGWKSSADAKRALPHPLRTDEDVKTAFGHFRPILSSTRRTKKVWMEIINLTKPAEKPAPAPKVTETAYRDELNIVKTALTCEKHRGNNRWCFVRRDDEKGPLCVPLGLEEITLWARKLERVLDDTCLTPPDVLHVDDLEKVAAQREERSKARKGRSATAPEIHVHIPPMQPMQPLPAFADVANTSHRLGKRGRDELSDDDESDDEDLQAASITEVLSMLDNKMPALNYPQYEAALRQQGIAYANAVDGFEREFFVDEIGMARGAVKEFVRLANKVAKGKGKKRARVDGDRNKENVA